MEPPDWLDAIAREVIGAAIAVHRELGPGFGEALYEEALGRELEGRGIAHQRQVRCPVRYRGATVGVSVIDLLVRDSLVVELKAVEQLDPIHHAQLLSYLRATNLELGLLINFNVALLRQGLKRVVWSHRQT